MKIETKFPFKQYNGYVITNNEDRKMVCLKHRKNKTRTTISYARYLMSVKEKRILDKSEQVDHIDGNKKNDNIRNLQILSGRNNVVKYLIQKNRTRKMVELKCPGCNTNFEKELGQCFLQKGGHFGCCSRKCLHKILEKGYSIDKLKKIGKKQVVRRFRRDKSFYNKKR